MTGRSLAVLAAFATLAFAAPATAAPGIQAHRGGSLVNGVPAYAENSLPAFAHAAAEGWVLEFDVKLTKDRVPVVIHDDTLDRTTTCSGLVSSKTAAQLRSCQLDYLGRPGESPPMPSAFIANPADRPGIPSLSQVLALASATGATISPEIKNIPPTTPEQLTENDFDPTFKYANAVSWALRASGFPQQRMIVQSFWPPNLVSADLILPRAQMSLLTLKVFNDGNPLVAGALRWEWVSAEFGTGLNPGVVPVAHALGRKVAVWTLNSAASMTAAAAQGVDAIITDDPDLARAVLGS